VSAQNWFAAMGQFLGGFPLDYLVLDTETQGVDVQSDDTLILQLGWAVVRQRELVSHGSVLLDWTRPDTGIDLHQLQTRMTAVRAAMAARGRTYQLTVDALQRDGVAPVHALQAVLDLIRRETRFVGHNLWAFDRVLLERHFRSYLNQPFKFPYDTTFDTGMVEKARMLRLEPPAVGSRAICRWYEQLAQDRRRVKWNLDEHCNQIYRLDGALAEAHDAEFDCLQQHKLLERMHTLSLQEVVCPELLTAS